MGASSLALYPIGALFGSSGPFRSVTAILMSATYVAATCIYLLWKLDRLVAVVVAVIVVLTSLVALSLLWSDPEFALSLLGKDTTLTGRTELWDAVVSLIKERPFLGYGYRAMWS